MLNELPILLRFEAEAKTIKLRLDQFGLNNFDLNDQTIHEIILRNYEIENSLLENLQKYIGQIFEYEVSNEENKINFEFWSDYSRIGDQIICESIEEYFCAYTNQDLAQKGKILSKLFIDINEKCQKNNSLFYSLTNKLDSEITNEIEKAGRKEQFYQNQNDGKSTAFHSQKLVLEKLLKIINENSFS